ncbi:membrane protein [Agromyces sp. 3263]|uniref:YihY/virulence factor BrkB family protein n=1 Tax=Agromyces sp. 3263 TaxID=2817750 RepID=UPI002865BFCB|nr:YihY/virulence factor BrkB family protein [Agromyces sp. 3263]MDR6904699.1 membrane protein [Agromyces sp. 3263]
MSERTPIDDDPLGTAAPHPVSRNEAFKERFEEPISRVSDLTHRTMALFPVRVWRHFLARNGFLLSSGMSYQALFAIFAAVYVVFAVAGIWLTADSQTLNAFIALLNSYAPGLIGDDGIISTDDLYTIATTSTSLFGWTGAVALAGLIWTAIGWITYSRIAVRSIFLLPKDTRAYVLLKTRDFIVGLLFGTILLLATVLTVATTSLWTWLVALLHLSPDSVWSNLLFQAGSMLVVFVIDAAALAVLFRFLSGAAMPWRRMWVGSLLGSAALTVLQLLGGLVITGAGKNPLLATFAVFIALLLWFRLTGIVILVAASWIAVEAFDHNETLRRVTPEQLVEEERAREQEALLTAARVRVREARADLERAGWFERISARRRLSRAEGELARLEAAAASPAPDEVGGLP